MKSILKDFPNQFETERLLIRSPHLDDAPLIFEAASESMAELLPWMAWAHGSIPAQGYTFDDAKEFARSSYANWIRREELPLRVFLKNSGTFIAGTGCHQIDWEIPKFEIGYWLRTSYTGQGYVTEAVNGITQFLRDHLDARRIEIRCDTLNVKSRAVAERAGYMLESHQRSAYRTTSGELRDDYLFAKTWTD